MISIKLDQAFIKKNLMGPSSYRIIEELTLDLKVKKGSKILDLGCGKALTSIYLAMKYDALVFAADLWIDPSENYSAVKAFGLEDKIIPLKFDANETLFADDFFDVIISVDAYQYFGRENGFLDDHIARLLKPSGEIRIAIPGLKNPYENNIPKIMQEFDVIETYFHSCDWWTNLWNKSSLVTDIECKEMTCYEKAWDDWLNTDNIHAISDRPMMKADGGKYLNIISLSAKREEK